MFRARAGMAWGFAALAAAVGAPSCTSRTLPLPPPEVREVTTPAADGLVTVRGSAREGASVGVVNDATSAGTIVTSLEENCGSACRFEATVKAASGDQLRVWQFYETDGAIDALVP